MVLSHLLCDLFDPLLSVFVMLTPFQVPILIVVQSAFFSKTPYPPIEKDIISDGLAFIGPILFSWELPHHWACCEHGQGDRKAQFFLDRRKFLEAADIHDSRGQGDAGCRFGRDLRVFDQGFQ